MNDVKAKKETKKDIIIIDRYYNLYDGLLEEKLIGQFRIDAENPKIAKNVNGQKFPFLRLECGDWVIHFCEPSEYFQISDATQYTEDIYYDGEKIGKKVRNMIIVEFIPFFSNDEENRKRTKCNRKEK